jgi:RND family efflux transporter MFP subunit
MKWQMSMNNLIRNSNLIAVCGLSLMLAIGCQRALPPPLPIPVRTVKLQKETITSEMRFSATVREWQRIELSFKVPGTVASMLQIPGPEGKLHDLHEGDTITSDPEHPLAKLDDSDYRRKLSTVQDKLAAAQAQERSALANVTGIRATFDRIKALRERESVSQQSYDETLAKRDSAEAQLDAAKRAVGEATVALQQVEDDLKNTQLVSPIPRAVVSRKNIEGGERVQAGQPIMQIMDLARVRVAFGISDAKLSNFRIGQMVSVTADAFPGEHYEGRISKIMPAADMKTRTFEVEMTIDEPKGLKPGMVVTILVGKQLDMLLLPMTAVQRGERKDDCIVYAVVEEEGRTIARRRSVRLDGVYDNRVRVVEGGESQVAVGDVIIVTGAFRLTDGQEVRLLEGQEAPLRIDM